MEEWDDRISAWLAHWPQQRQDPLPAMRQAGLLVPVADYATLARIKAALVERTGLLGIGSVWGGSQLVFRHFVRGFGTEPQQAAWSGKSLSVAISEPGVGAHPKHLTTRADADGDGYRISGQKAWVTNGPSADAIIVIAITAEDQGRKRYSAFVVPRDTPGLAMTEMPDFHALRPSRHALLTLDGCYVPATAVLGPKGAAYEAMALPFRDIEDTVGTFATVGALRHAIGLFAGAPSAGPEGARELGAVIALTSVFEAGAASVVSALDGGHLRTGNATLVGLRLLATDITARLRRLAEAGTSLRQWALTSLIADLDATLGIARGPRLARQVQLGEAALAVAGHPA